ncbi:kynurenine formamidase-like [Limulus polyphemus]|uniref:Kynurenine formamidase-like n=1 Tax=Limulus polyphemus TaxID=6850 RepID=A0ABM1STJ9_LIMPO|nr:kynurenine formamidase-like [Limulus polyphemus]XP_022246953.1 kynurenine formamidase-like [Limulus polyphemus]XP_022246954.1 kynurenine formamidase-like [Limulus polyphemus]XP_022246955.1 kynurenine formamidase-like [Limulus polyphemus]
MDEIDQDLEHQYSCSRWSKRFTPDDIINNYFSCIANESRKVKKEIDCKLDIRYGPRLREKMDVFGLHNLPLEAPIFVFLHGGYWVIGSREDSSVYVSPLHHCGIICITVGYNLAPEVTIDVIIDGVRNAVNFILWLAALRGSKGVYLCGHSAGAHLIATCMSSNVNAIPNTHMVKGLFLLSGIYDLRPLVKTTFGLKALITSNLAVENSPLLLLKEMAQNLDISCQVLVIVADCDSPSFKLQAEQYVKGLQSNGISVEYQVIPENDHFSIIERLKDPNFALTKEFIRRVTPVIKLRD